ncbi:hypothetical protein NBRC116594_16300 [Shimia sp. NS0008-38b]|uniref:hypothetical protein n=1 Tax=Shimia sp. NS0008-38b TaxID=3127653 RepID=UPI0031050C5C
MVAFDLTAGVALGAAGAVFEAADLISDRLLRADGAASFATVAVLAAGFVFLLGLAALGVVDLKTGSDAAGLVEEFEAGAAALVFAADVATALVAGFAADVRAAGRVAARLVAALGFSVGEDSTGAGFGCAAAIGTIIELIKARVMACDVRMLRSTMRDMKKNPFSEAVMELVAIVVI